MNKQELVQAVGSSIAKVDDVLKAMRLRTDAEEYKETHIEPIKEAIALIESQKISTKDAVKSLKNNTQLATSSSGAIATDSTVVGEEVFELPGDVVDGVDGVIGEVCEESIDEAADIIVGRAHQNGESMARFLVDRVDKVWAEEAQKRFSDPGFPDKLRKAIELGKSKRSQNHSN